MKKKIIAGLLAFIILAGTALYIYINKVFLPVKLREIILTKSEEFLGRKVTFKTIDYELFQGLVVDNLTIYDKDDPSLIFVHFDQARLNVLFAPLLKKQIIIPSIVITRPQIHLVRKEPNVWNFSDLLARRRPAGAKSPFNVLLGGIIIDRGQIELTDKTAASPTTEKFENLNLKTHLSLKSGVQFELKAQAQPETSLAITGNYVIAGRTLTAQLKVHKLDPFKYMKMFFIPPNFIHRSGTIETAALEVNAEIATPPIIKIRGSAVVSNADVTVQGDKIIQGELITGNNLILTRKGFETHLTGDVAVKNGNVTLANGRSFAGDAIAEGMDLTGGYQKVNVAGKLNVQNANFIIDPERSIHGNLSSNHLSFKRENGTMLARGDITGENAHLILSPTRQFKGNLSSPLINYQFTEGHIEVKGRIDVLGADFTIGQTTIQGNLKTQETNLTWGNDKRLNVATAFLLENGQVQIDKDKKFIGTLQAGKTDLTMAEGKLTAQGHWKISQGYLRLSEGRTFTGDPVIDFEVTHVLRGQVPLEYAGTLTVTNAALSGLPKIGDAQKIQGTVTFANNQIQSDSLNLRAMDSNISLAGSLTDFENPSVNIEASSPNVDLEKIRPFITALLDKYKMEPSGTADITLRYKGPINNPKLAKITVGANLKKVSLISEKILSPITDISGKISYTGQSVSWQNLSGIFKNTAYTITGRVDNFDEPTIETDISAPQLKLTTSLQSRDGIYKILSCKGTYFNSSFDIKGHYAPIDGNPEASLSGTIDLQLKDLTSLLPKFKKNIESYKPSGTISLETSFNGKINDWHNGQLNATGTSEAVTLNGFKFKDVALEITHGKYPTSRVDLSATFYNGPLHATMFIDPKRDDLAMTLAANLKDSDLEQLAKDTPSKGKAAELKGYLGIDLNLEGPLAQTAKWRGRGSAAITDGQIFKFNLLKGIWRTLLIPEFEDIMFTHARTNFEIHNKRLVTKDLVLSSSPVDLSAVGWIDFDGKINMNVNPQIKQLTILQSASLKKGPTALLAQAQEYINIKISGTLKKPEYNIRTQPVKALEKTTGSIIEGVQGIFEDIIN